MCISTQNVIGLECITKELVIIRTVHASQSLVISNSPVVYPSYINHILGDTRKCLGELGVVTKNVAKVDMEQMTSFLYMIYQSLYSSLLYNITYHFSLIIIHRS